MTIHQHRSIKSEIVGWTGCVRLDGQSCTGAAHGGITHVYECSCGLRRMEERNGRATVRQTWEQAQDARDAREAGDARHEAERAERRRQALANLRSWVESEDLVAIRPEEMDDGDLLRLAAAVGEKFRAQHARMVTEREAYQALLREQDESYRATREEREAVWRSQGRHVSADGRVSPIAHTCPVCGEAILGSRAWRRHSRWAHQQG